MIVGISGKMGSGKSTAAESLKSLGRPVCILKLAAPLYAIQNFIYNAIAPVYTPPEGFVKDRKLLQWIGTDFGRSLDRDLWTKLWRHRAEYLMRRDSQLIL